MENLGYFMLAGMIIGGTASAINNSKSEVTDACKGLEDARKKLKDTKDKWNEIIYKEEIVSNEFDDFLKSLATSKNTLDVQTKNATKAYKKQQYILITSFVIMIITVILSLLFKKLKVFSYLEKILFS